jgi:hypothetical protein
LPADFLRVVVDAFRTALFFAGTFLTIFFAGFFFVAARPDRARTVVLLADFLALFVPRRAPGRPFMSISL